MIRYETIMVHPNTKIEGEAINTYHCTILYYRVHYGAMIQLNTYIKDKTNHIIAVHDIQRHSGTIQH